ncbi:uncharacterized protein DUF2572 [Pasteurella langaaensis DSM 22999]|uniref:Uncharacterized protein DUF2572 n=1 Tax=Alitibacter langaaensis DSM 22999 TaxID=1122935 RepID=A0A2U0SM01_9PAST|nr:DUF2572 family protein [Pasteurella langaaensis]PVX32384.1 uncharacterized protein DUF2572 [Pasteurella langaaensis DSM 22999]
MKLYRGVMTLTLLMLLSSTLLIFMLFDDDMLRLHSALTAHRQHYVEQSSALQEISQQAKRNACAAVPLEISENVYRVEFQLENFPDDNQHYLWCERKALFKKAPKKGNLAQEFHNYINNSHISLFRSQLNAPNFAKSADKNAEFYWFDSSQTEWNINGNITAVIVAEGNLQIKGKGKIMGTVITAGQLLPEQDIAIVYNKNVVNQVVQQYSQWQRAEKSWYDFNP